MNSKKPLRTSKVDTTINRYYPFLMEVRKRILFLAVFFVTFAIAGFFYYEKLIRYILAILKIDGVNVVFTSPFQFFNLAVSSGLVVATILTFPLIIQQIISFLKPGLKKKEFRILNALIPLSILLFLIGFGFGFTMMRYVITVFYSKSLELDIGNFLDISRLLTQIMVTSSLLGVSFQFPIVMTLLMRFKIVHHKMMVKQRSLAYLASVIFASLLPPTDILSLLLLTLPLVFLFELTLILNRVFLKTHLL